MGRPSVPRPAPPSALPAVLRAALLASLLAAAASAEEGPPLTALEAGTLGRSDLVVLGRVETVAATPRSRGVQIATVAVERVLKGEAPRAGAPLTVMVGGPRPTNDPQAPTVPYLDAAADVPQVLFLRRRDEGESWRLLTSFPADGTLGAEKIAVLEKHVALARIPQAAARARATRDFLLEAQGAAGTWTRVHAAREINHLVGVRPEAFDAEARRRLQDVAGRARLPAQRTWLVRALQQLRCAAPPAPEEKPTEVPPDVARLRELLAEAEADDGRVEVLRAILERGRSRALPLLFRVLPETPPATRAAFVDLLAEGGWTEAREAVQGLYAGEPAAEVQRAVVRAVGRLGGAEAVPWLADRTASLRVQREALIALARIRTPEALAALERFRAEIARDGAEGDKDVTALVEYLLGPAFEEIEAIGRGPSR